MQKASNNTVQSCFESGDPASVHLQEETPVRAEDHAPSFVITNVCSVKDFEDLVNEETDVCGRKFYSEHGVEEDLDENVRCLDPKSELNRSSQLTSVLTQDEQINPNVSNCQSETWHSGAENVPVLEMSGIEKDIIFKSNLTVTKDSLHAPVTGPVVYNLVNSGINLSIEELRPSAKGTSAQCRSSQQDSGSACVNLIHASSGDILPKTSKGNTASLSENVDSLEEGISAKKNLDSSKKMRQRGMQQNTLSSCEDTVPLTQLSTRQASTDQSILDNSEINTVKFEPLDKGYEADLGLNLSASSKLPAWSLTASDCQTECINTNNNANLSSSKSVNCRKRSHSVGEHEQHFQMCKNKQRRKLEKQLSSAGETSNTMFKTLKKVQKIITWKGSSVSEKEKKAALMSKFKVDKAHGTLTKRLVVPPSCTAKKRSAQQNIQTKSIFLALPPYLVNNQTSSSTSSCSTSTPSMASVENHSLLPVRTAATEAVRTESVTRSSIIDKQLSDQLVTRLRHVQDKPGSHQMITVPMPDGSTQNVKIVFAPLQQSHEAVNANPSQCLTLTAHSSESEVQKSVTTFSMAASSMSVGSNVYPIMVIQGKDNQSGVSSTYDASNTSKAILYNDKKQGQSVSTCSSLKTMSAVSISNVPPVPANLLQPCVILPKKPLTVSEEKSRQQTIHVIASAPSKVSCKQDVRFDQVSSEAKLSASDMAALIQGKNLIPSLELKWQSGNSGGKKKNRIYRCMECGIICSTVVGYSVHVKRMSMVIRYACMDCKAALVFFNKCTFLAHLRKHSAGDDNAKGGQVLNLKSYTMSVSSLPDELLAPVGLNHMDPMVINWNQPIPCTECHKILPDTAHLAAHYGMNTSLCSFEYPCPHCEMQLSSACALKAHLRLHDEASHTLCARSPFVCPECGLSFPNQLSLYQHLFATCLHFSRCLILKCPVCDKYQPSLDMLRDHLLLFYPRHKAYRCKLCASTYMSVTSFQQHLEIAHQLQEPSAVFNKEFCFETTFCVVCRSLTADEIQEHMQEHIMALKPVKFGYFCMLCNKQQQKNSAVYEKRHHLIQHLISKHQAYKFVCSICIQGFVTLSLLRFHVSLEHSTKHKGQETGTVACRECNGHSLCSESALPHVMWHVMKRLLKTAAVSSKTSPSVQKQIMEITRDFGKSLSGDTGKNQERQSNMFFCKACGYVFPSLYSLQGHMTRLKHTVFNNFLVCPFCQRFDFWGYRAFLAHKKLCVYGKKDNVSTSQRKGARQLDATRSLLQEGTNMAKSEEEEEDMDETSSSYFSAETCTLSPKRKRPDAEKDLGRMEEAVNTPAEVQFHACHLCGLAFKSATVLARHLERAHSGEKNVMHCQLCLKKKKKEVLLTRERLYKHLVRRHKVARAAAEAMAADNKPSDPHKMQVWREAEPEDSENSSSTSGTSSSPFKRLRIAGQGQEDYVCAKCGFSTTQTAQFLEHIASHAVENCAQCLECGLCFSALPSLKKHLFLVHRVKEPGAYIEQHDIRIKGLNPETVLSMDVLSPLGQPEEPEVVMKTSELYRNASSLHQTTKVASRTEGKVSVSVLECTVCYREFDTEAALKSHMRTHGMAFIRSRRYDSRHAAGSNVGQAGDDSKGNGLHNSGVSMTPEEQVVNVD